MEVLLLSILFSLLLILLAGSAFTKCYFCRFVIRKYRQKHHDTMNGIICSQTRRSTIFSISDDGHVVIRIEDDHNWEQDISEFEVVSGAQPDALACSVNNTELKTNNFVPSYEEAIQMEVRRASNTSKIHTEINRQE